ncbi:hypothetical protein BLA50215_00008 [Burkholderia lata]|uniref:hypothetical protein n=1 Tax=Burkholderia lata (strain ATCC 17760 / DSM 23089 / LMG 22485 / NCIMB 9086 / R18194 / 383) TaxID=482957 RepID=UPI0014534FB3|nr:hypothetical protein [Burkholderia lata]VWC63970.1 hypothetical protein BLA50215_00008 [Burkholderia lata]
MTTIQTSGGEFEFAVYAPYNSNPTEPVGGRINAGVDTALWFRADLDSDNVRLVQLIRPQGQWINDRERARAANGWSLDSNSLSPWYGTNDQGALRPIRDLTPNITPQLRDWIKQNGIQTSSGPGSRRGKGYQRAWIVDIPRHMAARVGELVQVRLVTIAVDVQHSAFLGGVEWGFNLSEPGVVTVAPAKLAFKVNPAGDYLQALDNWNLQAGNTPLVLPA